MKPELKKEILEWVKTIGLSIILALIITSVVKPTVVKGISMNPTLVENDYLIIYKLAYKSEIPKFKDIVVFESDLKQENGKEKDLVKRIIGVPGDHIVVKDGEVYLNEKQLSESYINDGYTDGQVDLVVPKGKVFAMGDNRLNSMDSRSQEVGLVDMKDILGKVVVRLYPFNKVGSFK